MFLTPPFLEERVGHSLDNHISVTFPEKKVILIRCYLQCTISIHLSTYTTNHGHMRFSCLTTQIEKFPTD